MCGKIKRAAIPKARKIARPPADGMGFLLIRLAFGLSTAPILRDTKVMIGVKIKARPNVIKVTIKNLTAKGMLIIVCTMCHRQILRRFSRAPLAIKVWPYSCKYSRL